jgi:hypothetical protein
VISNSSKGEVTEYRVVNGDTVSSIAQKFGVSVDSPNKRHFPFAESKVAFQRTMLPQCPDS